MLPKHFSGIKPFGSLDQLDSDDTRNDINNDMPSKTKSEKLSKPSIPLSVRTRHDNSTNQSNEDDSVERKQFAKHDAHSPQSTYASRKERKLVGSKRFDDFNEAAIRLSKAWSDHFHHVLECYDRIQKRSRYRNGIYDVYGKAAECIVFLLMRIARNRKLFAQLRIMSLENTLKLVKLAFTHYMHVFKNDYIHKNSDCMDKAAIDNANDDSESQRKCSDDVERELKYLKTVLRTIGREYS